MLLDRHPVGVPLIAGPTNGWIHEGRSNARRGQWETPQGFVVSGAPGTCCPAVALHPQLVASLGVSHAELVVDGVRCLPVVAQVHPELVLPLGCDFVQVVQPWGQQARIDAEARVMEAITSTPPCRSCGPGHSEEGGGTQASWLVQHQAN